MTTSVYISNEQIDIVQGTVSNNLISVKKVVTIPAPEGAIINGLIIDSKAIEDKLKQAFDENKDLDRKVKITVDSGSIYTKVLNVPNLPEKKLSGIIMSDFSEIDNYENFLYDYMIIDSSKKKTEGLKILACAIEKEYLDNYIEMFNHLNLKIKGINISLACGISLMNRFKALSEKTYVVSIFDKFNMTSILFVDGIYSYTSRARLVEEMGTEKSVAEVSGIFSSIIQFNKVEHGDKEIEDFYYCGLSEKPELYVNQITKNLKKNFSELITADNIKFVSDDKESVDEHFYTIGNLI